MYYFLFRPHKCNATWFLWTDIGWLQCICGKSKIVLNARDTGWCLHDFCQHPVRSTCGRRTCFQWQNCIFLVWKLQRWPNWKLIESRKWCELASLGLFRGIGATLLAENDDKVSVKSFDPSIIPFLISACQLVCQTWHRESLSHAVLKQVLRFKWCPSFPPEISFRASAKKWPQAVFLYTN